MAYDEVFTRNDSGELSVRVSNSTGDTSTNKDDIYTRDGQGRLCVRTTGDSGGGTGTVASVNGVQPVDGNVEITGDNITATVGEEEATITQHLTTFAGEISAKVNIDQGADNAGKVMTGGADCKVEPTAGYATESWVNQQIQTQIGTIETALAEV